jgi:hypothetical protein
LSKITEDSPKPKKEEFKISLIGLESGSIGCHYAIENYSKFSTQCNSVITAIRESRYSSLNQKGYESLKKILTFAGNNNCKTTFYHKNGNVDIVAEIPLNFQLPPLSFEIKTKAVVYGYVNTVGGKDPNVHIELLNGNTLICSVNEEQAKALANRLYSWVGLKGIAKWDYRLNEYTSMKVEDIIEFQTRGIYRTVEVVSEKYGKYFSEINDVEKYVENLRKLKTEKE